MRVAYNLNWATVKMSTKIKTKHHSFEEFASSEFDSGLKGKIATQLMFMYRKAIEKKAPVILELGTDKGLSTTVFLQACEDKNGKLVSVDIEDCSDISDSDRWDFIRSDSTDVNNILAQAPHLNNGIDIIYIDSLHSQDHVQKELTGWFPYMNKNSWIFFDDVDPNPYRKGNRKDHFNNEIAWNKIHEYVQAFFYSNQKNLFLQILYGSTGLACLYKISPKGTLPNEAKPIIHRKKTFFSLLRHNPLRLISLSKRKLLGILGIK